MTEVRQSQERLATIRRLPIGDALVAVLRSAGEAAGIDVVEVVSGGQFAHGKGPRTGSTRHDDGKAADVQLFKAGRLLDFEDGDRDLVAAFVSAAAARGATGIGAGVGYMGPHRLHIGFGSQLVWGAGGRAVNAPAWLRQAAAKGWASPVKERPTLRLGDQGEDVATLQRALHGEGFDPGPDDGDFGPKTERAVIAFQQSRAIKTDGVAGPRTWAMLEA